MGDLAVVCWSHDEQRVQVAAGYGKARELVWLDVNDAGTGAEWVDYGGKRYWVGACSLVLCGSLR